MPEREKDGSRRMLYSSALVVVVSLAVTAGSLFQLWMAWTSSGWPTVPGTVTDASIVEGGDSSGPDYTLQVAYRYEVKGKTYLGNRVTATGEPRSRGEGDLEPDLKRFAKGATPEVHYDAAFPDIAVLVTGAGENITLPIVFAWLGATLFVGGIRLFRGALNDILYRRVMGTGP